MPSIYRRSLLRAAAVGAVGFSGCSTFSEESESQTPRLIDLVALSYDTQAHTFHVRLELDGEPVYEQAEPVDAASPEDSEGAVFTRYPEEPKPYVLSAWIDDDESTTRTLDLASYEAECLAVNLFYGRYGEPPEDATLGIATATNCNAEE